ncbi:MAG: SOS response-associated peptidase [Actinomycetia bacterium]|nr:SOS response-associated peptidase [Actinomycetes bacterium]
MCGRYVNVASDGEMAAEFDVEETVGPPLPPSWNVAPTHTVAVIVARPSSGADAPTPIRQRRAMRWGLVPSWSRSLAGGPRMINARCETVAEKPAFRAAAARRRCLLPALGYYEWHRAAGRSVPYFLHAPGEPLLAMAGLYELWRDRSRPADDPGRWVWTCAIITRAAPDALGEIHDRCPVLVPSRLRAPWLGCAGDDPAIASRLLDEMPAPCLAPRAVSAAVGNVGNNGPELIAPLSREAEAAVAPASLDWPG